MGRPAVVAGVGEAGVDGTGTETIILLEYSSRLEFIAKRGAISMTTVTLEAGGLLQWAGAVLAIGASVGAVIAVILALAPVDQTSYWSRWGLLWGLILGVGAAWLFHVDALSLLMPTAYGTGWDAPRWMGGILIGLPAGLLGWRVSLLAKPPSMPAAVPPKEAEAQAEAQVEEPAAKQAVEPAKGE
jgi:hypothetical protein